MQRAAIGVRMHSGWGAVVAVTGKPGTVEVIDRKRIVVTDEKIPGAKQPYHFAKTLGLSEAEKHLAKCAGVSERLALAAVRDLVGELKGRDYRVVAAAVLLASGRPVPPLAEILASHALIHTAEGEFFRRVLWKDASGWRFASRGFESASSKRNPKHNSGSERYSCDGRSQTWGRLSARPGRRIRKLRLSPRGWFSQPGQFNAVWMRG